MEQRPSTINVKDLVKYFQSKAEQSESKNIPSDLKYRSSGSVREKTSPLFQQGLDSELSLTLQEQKDLADKISALLPCEKRKDIDQWLTSGVPTKILDILEKLHQSMDFFLAQPRDKYPIEDFRAFIDRLPPYIQKVTHNLFNYKIQIKEQRLNNCTPEPPTPSSPKLPETPPPEKCTDKALAFLRHHPFLSYTGGWGISLGTSYLIKPKGTQEFVTAMPSGDSVEKFFNNALAMYLTPVVLVLLIVAISAGYRYKKQKPSIMYQLMGTPTTR